MLKKTLVVIFLSTVLFLPILTLAQSQKVELYFFWANGCPHCAKENVFLDKLTAKYPNYLEVKSLEVTGSQDNVLLLQEFGHRLNADISGVPFTVIGDQYFIGFNSEQTTGASIENAVLALMRPPDFTKPPVISPTNPETMPVDQLADELITENLTVPIFGELDLKTISLPVITIILGALDGFNPCAMWTLLFLISLLLGMKNRRRMWTLGITFIVASAAVYFLFMVAWLNLILFLGFIVWIRLVIAAIALLGGGYNVRKFFRTKAGACEVVGTEKRQRTFAKLKAITQQKSFILALVGIILLALAVNLVELICSAGLPAVYTQILALNDLVAWQYYLYIGLYIFIFMLDDILIFIIAMVTLRLTGVSTKYSHWSSLIGGILMVAIGILLLLRPEWLMFG